MCASLFLVTYLTKFTQKTNVACDCGEFSDANTYICLGDAGKKFVHRK